MTGARRSTPAGSDTTQREAVVLGNGPRIDPLPVEAASEELMQIMQRMDLVNSAIDSRDREHLSAVLAQQGGDTPDEELSERLRTLPEIIRTMLRHPRLFASHADIGIQLLGHGALPARERELAVLRIGWLCQAPYQWGEHVLVARKLGISSADIERVTQGSSAPGWSEHEQAILRATEELYENAMISDPTWATLAKRLDDRQLIELPILVGQYQAVAYYQNSLRLRLHEGNRGLKAR